MPENPDLVPVHYRWRLGPKSPIVTGPVAGINGGAIVAIVGQTSLCFTRFDLVVNAPQGPQDMEPSFATGGSPPTGSSLVVDIERSTDGGNTWASIFTAFEGNPVSYPTLKPGQLSATTTPFLLGDGSAWINFQDQLRANVLHASGTEQNVQLTASGVATRE
jgi:hypothetical protein